MNTIENGCWSARLDSRFREDGRLKTPEKSASCAACPDDSGILYTDDPLDAFMIHAPGIRLVHIRQDVPEVSTRIAAVNDLAFFQNLDSYLHDYAVAGEAYAALWPQAHLPVIREIGQYHVKLAAFFQALVGSPSFESGIRNVFNGAASTFVANRWHTDNKKIVMTTAIEGGGTEYLAGPIDASGAQALIRSPEQQPPAHTRAVVAAPGDILVMKGQKAETRAGDTTHEKAARAIFHRSFPTAGRRTVLLYGF